MLDKLKSAIPIISILVPVLSIIKIYFYYSLFGVPIFNYIGLEEITTFIIEDLIIGIPIIFIFYLFENFMIALAKKRNESRKPPTTRQIKFAKIFLVFYYLFYISLAIIMCVEVPAITTYVFAAFVIVFIGVALLLLIFEKTDFVKNIDDKTNRLVMYVLMFVFISIGRSSWSYHVAKGISNIVVLKTNTGKYYRSNGNTIYIGRTYRFVFIKVNDMVHVIPQSSIEEFRFVGKHSNTVIID